jgi:hypothetical protein
MMTAILGNLSRTWRTPLIKSANFTNDSLPLLPFSLYANHLGFTLKRGLM